MSDGDRRTLFITGGSRGIGAAVVQEAARTGWNVAFTYAAREDAAREVAEAARAAAADGGATEGGGGVRYWRLDVRDADAVDRVADEVVSAFDGVRAVVCNAGVNLNGLAYSMEDADWRTVIDTNLSSIFYTCRAAARPMMKRRAGAIVNISSIVGVHGNFGQTNYAASKAGIIGFTKSLARELGSRNVRANVVAPGYVRSQLTDALPEGATELMLQNTPLGRLGDPEDVAGAVRFLCSDEAAFVTGAVLLVDGGLGM
jgi:3-oxoacyl-[acyl-carrier protein] reductase